jgi:hypothetical protein
MSREALKDLLEKVEAGETVTPHDFIRTGIPLLRKHATDAWLAQANSLDAAMALHKAVLPGWRWSAVPNNGGVRVGVWNTQAGSSYRQATHTHDIPARAWLIAILKALIAEQE